MMKVLATLVVLFLAATAIASAELNDGLTAYYPLDGSGDDVSGNSNDATVNGATPTADRYGSSDR